MKIDEDLIADLVKQVMQKMATSNAPNSNQYEETNNYDLFDSMYEAIEAAEIAQINLNEGSMAKREL